MYLIRIVAVVDLKGTPQLESMLTEHVGRVCDPYHEWL